MRISLFFIFIVVVGILSREIQWNGISIMECTNLAAVGSKRQIFKCLSKVNNYTPFMEFPYLDQELQQIVLHKQDSCTLSITETSVVVVITDKIKGTKSNFFVNNNNADRAEVIKKFQC